MSDGVAGPEPATGALGAPPAAGSGRPAWSRPWQRQLAHYPPTGRRVAYLAVVVLASVVLYYQQYVQGAVSALVLAHFQMSFRYYLTVLVAANAMGALASLAAGLADRWGRANLVVGGLLVAGLTTAFGIPAAPNRLVYAALVSVMGLAEGVALVATPALVRDFSPQVRRGTAMGVWTLGPVLGSLTVSEVASHTLDHLGAWQDQFHIAGLVGLVVFAVTFVGLRELTPQLRDQRMVSLRERVLVEVRARGVDVATALRRPWRQMMTSDVVLPAVGVSLFLLIYYAAVAFFVIYFTSVFGFSSAQANGLGNWFWSADAVAVVVSGALCDRLGVRKPFMVAGGVVAVVMTLVFASRATDPATTYGTFVVIISVMSASRGVAYAPWMTAFTETLERRNPALVATGLAVWGWVLRAVVAITFLVVPYVVTAASPVADYGPRLLAIETRYPSEVATLQAIDPGTRAALAHDQHDAAAIERAVQEIAAAQHVSSGQAVKKLLAVRTVPAADRRYLSDHGPQVLAARQQAPAQWQRWWWVCVGGELAFLPTVLVLAGRWRPSRARRDAEEHRRQVEAELARLTGASAGTPAPSAAEEAPAHG